ncbi:MULTISPECIES: hypothetical protein [unclassified Myxococcus]|uniref:hypothetical protein n=1 Tax=unclassified Myxococcus TaxID=2648731 RepID=UPI00157B9268|nr:MULTISPECIES: hypothetical protein [unclassified Myxococcus]NTX08345.1 hypothetical protein [Myxococcus sp. CA040A]
MDAKRLEALLHQLLRIAALGWVGGECLTAPMRDQPRGMNLAILGWTMDAPFVPA